MSFEDFINTFSYGINLFINSLISFSNSLIHNYFFIVLLGLVLFVSLFYFFTDFIYDLFNKKLDSIDEKLDKKKVYELNRELRNEYLKEHRLDEYMYLYDYTVLKQQVFNSIYRYHFDVVQDNIKLYNDLKKNALKKLHKEYLLDDDDSNDSDINYLVPDLPNPQLSSKSELSNSLKSKWLKEFDNQLKNENKNDIVNIMNNNKDLLNKLGVYYDSKSNNFYDLKTGELVDIFTRKSSFSIPPEPEKPIYYNNFYDELKQRSDSYYDYDKNYYKDLDNYYYGSIEDNNDYWHGGNSF